MTFGFEYFMINSFFWFARSIVNASFFTEGKSSNCYCLTWKTSFVNRVNGLNSQTPLDQMVKALYHWLRPGRSFCRLDLVLKTRRGTVIRNLRVLRKGYWNPPIWLVGRTIEGIGYCNHHRTWIRSIFWSLRFNASIRSFAGLPHWVVGFSGAGQRKPNNE